MSTNFTPLPSSVAHGKGAVDVNAVLIIIAICITLLLAGLMWFLIAQKQIEEKQIALPIDQTPVTKEVVQENTDRVTPTVTGTATLSPTATPAATLTPQASPSAIINQ